MWRVCRAVLVSPNGGSNGSNINGTELPTCDPNTQPALAPNFAQLDVNIAPGSSKDIDSYLCTRGTTGVDNAIQCWVQVCIEV